MSAAAWSIGGLFTNMVGVLILFRYGMPFRVRTGGAQYLLLEGEDKSAKALEVKYKKLGYLGLGLILLGTILQAGGVYLSKP